MMRTVRPIGLAAAVLVIASGCSRDAAWPAVLQAVEMAYPDVRHVTTDSLARWMSRASLPQPLLLDVRSPEEYAVSHLQGALRIDPDTETFTALEARSRDAPIVAYCSVGYRSSALVSRLQTAGFTNVANLQGSIFRWANERRPVYRADRPVGEVHHYDGAWGRLLDEELHAARADVSSSP
jgi:rhodanese-related sulfurtransferase